MPHSNHNTHASSTGDDLGSTDEVKIFKDEGDREDEKISSENLLEEKSSLIDLTESEEKSVKNSTRHDLSPVYGKEAHSHAASFNMGYLSISPYSYANGAAGIPVSMANKMMPFFCHNGDHLTSPPPAHCGIAPYQLDPKAIGLSRPALYSFPPSQYPYPMLSPDMSQVASWHTPSMYSAAPGFRNSYSTSLQINTTLPSDFYRFSPTTLIPSVHSHHVLNSGIIPTSIKQDPGAESINNRQSSEQKSGNCTTQSETKDNANDKKKPHIKKPLNAFMLYMKEMRAKVVAECTLKESAAINQILGRKWHSLSRDEQSIYYDKARQERQLHMELYPGWSARDNYGYGSKKKKRKKDRSPADSGGNNMKKCRARYGLDQQNQWCKPCRRKKKCIRYKESENDDGVMVSDENLGSCGSVDEAHTPDDDVESLNQSLSSPGCLSGLSSLQSPSTSLASPLNLLASPSTPLNFYHTETPTNSQSLNNINSSFSNNTSRNSSNTSTNNGSHSNNNSSNNNNNNHNNNSDNDENVDDNNNENDDDSVERNDPPSSNDHHHHHHHLHNIHNSNHDEENGRKSREIPSTPSSSSSSSSLTPSSSTPSSSTPSSSSTLLSTSISSTPSSSSTLLSTSISSTAKLPINYFSKNDFKMKNPVGANPRDVNNPLSINQLTKRDFITNQYNHQQDFLNVSSRYQQDFLNVSSRYQHTPFHHNLNHNFSLPQLPSTKNDIKMNEIIQ